MIVKMAHREYNKQRRGTGFFLIIFGAILFMVAPWQLAETPELGWTVIIFGFLIGGIGFYLNFVKGRSKVGK